MAVSYLRRAMAEPEPPPAASHGVWARTRERLFSGPLNILMTVASAIVLAAVAVPLLRFLVIDAVWDGASRVDCLAETVGHPVGACWPFIGAKFTQLVYGFYPWGQHWRVDLTFVLGVVLLLPLLIPRAPFKLANAILFFGVFPIVAFYLLVGGRFGLEHVETRSWGWWWREPASSCRCRSASCWRSAVARRCRSCTACRSSSLNSGAACR